jgi:hypothetical protein
MSDQSAVAMILEWNGLAGFPPDWGLDNIFVVSPAGGRSYREPDQRLLGVGGEIRMGSAIDASMMHAITWRPLV